MTIHASDNNVTIILIWEVIYEQGSPKDGYITRRGVFLEHFVFLSTWLVRWIRPKLYTTTGQEWENREYKLFDR